MSEMARRLIEQAKKDKSKILDLGNCGIVGALPEEVGELYWLEHLNLSGDWGFRRDGKWHYGKSAHNGPKNEITSLPANLPKPLSHLIAASNPLADISSLQKLEQLQTINLRNTKVVDISDLKGLKEIQKLILSSTNLADISPLEGFTKMQVLGIAATNVADISPLKAMKVMKSIDLSKTHLEDLSPLRGLRDITFLNCSETLVEDISALADLHVLETLLLDGTQITDLEALKDLKALQVLHLHKTPLADISALRELHNLLKLSVAHSRILDISALSKLKNLRELYINDTKVEDISPLKELFGLRTLNLSRTQVRDIAALEGLAREGLIFWVNGCALINPPIEVSQKGQKAILNYWKELEAQGTEYLYEAKVLLVGEGGAGKTSLLRRLYCPELDLPEEKGTTKGIEIHRHDFQLRNGRSMRLNVWDFGGQEIYHSTHQFFLTRRSLYVLLDDTRKDHRTVQDEGFKYWLEVVDLLSDHSPMLIFQNEKGGRSKAIDMAGIVGRFPNVKEKFAGNLELVDAGKVIREAIEYYAARLPHIGSPLPAKWVKIREEIERRSLVDATISQEDYFTIYRRHLPFFRTKALFLSDHLHSLGVFLHFQHDHALENLVILKNAWATEAVFKVIDNEAIKAQAGRFGIELAKEAWSASQYAGKHRELLALMIKFELCYELQDVRPVTWLAPGLLQVSKPIGLEGWMSVSDLVLRYQYDFLPKGLINRLMVRMHRYVRNTNLAWRNGVFFEHEDAELLAEVSPKGNEIVLRAKGNRRKDLLVVISADLEAMHHKIGSLDEKVKKLVTCICSRCRTIPAPEEYEHKKLLQRREEKRLKIVCQESDEDVSVLELLDGIGAAVVTQDGFSWMRGEFSELHHRFECLEHKLNTHHTELIRKLVGVKEFQGTVFEYIRAMEDRLSHSADLNQEELRILLACIEDGISLTLEELDATQQSKLKELQGKQDPSLMGNLAEVLKIKLPLLALTLALACGDDAEAAKLLLGSLVLDTSVKGGKQLLVEAWEKAVFFLMGKGNKHGIL